MEKVAVIGAGLVGSLQASILAQKGFKVEVYERRPDMRKEEIAGGRSINLALSDRGWKALKAVGVDKEVMKDAIPMYGRIMHSIDGELTYQPYGKENQAIYSVSRGGLNEILVNHADKFQNVELNFNYRCEDIDLENKEIHFVNTTYEEERHLKFDRVFATDGAFSAVRLRMQKTDRFDFSQHYLEHGYKELTIPAGKDGQHQLDKNALHIWPRGQYMLIALANPDGSFTCTLFFPYEGDPSFATLTTDDKINDFFKEVFPDAYEMMPTLVEDFHANPTASLVTVRCDPWIYKDHVMLMGDSAHAIVPFYGQGMNSGFEDCYVFNQLFEEYNGHWMKTFKEYNRLRIPDGNAIADLALRNFIEMRDLTGDPTFLLQKKIESKFNEKYPEKWLPLYSQVTFSELRYSEALAGGKVQDKIMEEVMKMPNIENIWDSDAVENKMLELIEKHK